jgi:ABC-type spermidine/putrescine transport system permease subunit II
MVTGVIGIFAGWGLYERRSWARILAIVLAFLSLLHPPFGTAIGAYTLWVLLPAASEAEYQRVARA